MNLLMCMAVLSGWGGGNCAVAQPVAVAQLRPGVGGLCSDQCTCGCNDGSDCPCRGFKHRRSLEPEKVSNFGVETDKVQPGKTWVGCKECSAGEAVAAINATVADDSKSLRVAIIGTPAVTAPVAAALRATGGKALVQEYDPADPVQGAMIAGLGFKTD